MAKVRRYDLVSIGDATVDVLLKLHDATLQCALDRRSCLFCLRYADKIPVEECVQIPAAGNAANHAVGSARLGLRVAIVTTLGKDDAGRRILTALAKNRVATAYVRQDRRGGTNYSTILSYRGERTILVYHAPRTYTFPRLAPAGWVYLTSMGKGWERIAPPLLRYLSATGASLAFNPGTHQLLSRSAAFRALVAAAAVLFVNREEAARILRRRAAASVTENLERLRAQGPPTVVITDGPQGAYALSGGRRWFMPPYPVSARERTGAGDAFSTGFLAAHITGQDVPESLRWGTINAGSVIQYVGPQAGLLTTARLRVLLWQHARLVARPL